MLNVETRLVTNQVLISTDNIASVYASHLVQIWQILIAPASFNRRESDQLVLCSVVTKYSIVNLAQFEYVFGQAVYGKPSKDVVPFDNCGLFFLRQFKTGQAGSLHSEVPADPWPVLDSTWETVNNQHFQLSWLISPFKKAPFSIQGGSCNCQR
jgi:hypothetical protein